MPTAVRCIGVWTLVRGKTLIDIVEPGTKYNVFEYQRDFAAAYADVVSRGGLPVMCGGTGLYIEAVLKGYRLMPVPENKDLRSSLECKTLPELTEILTKLKVENGSVMHNKTDVDTVKRAVRAIEIKNTTGRKGKVSQG